MRNGGIICWWFGHFIFLAMLQMVRLELDLNATDFNDTLVPEDCKLWITDFESVQKQFQEYAAAGNARLVDIRISGIKFNSSNEAVEVFDPNLWSWVAEDSVFLTKMPIDFHILSFTLSWLTVRDLKMNMTDFPHGCFYQKNFTHRLGLVSEAILLLTENVPGNTNLICLSTYSLQIWYAGTGVGRTCFTRKKLDVRSWNDFDIEEGTDHEVTEFSQNFGEFMIILLCLLPAVIISCVINWWHGNKKMSLLSEHFVEYITVKPQKWAHFTIYKPIDSEKKVSSPDEAHTGSRSVTEQGESENTPLLDNAQIPDKAEDTITLLIAENELVSYEGPVSILELLSINIRGVAIGKIKITIFLLLHFVLVVYWLTYYNCKNESFERLNSTEKILFSLFGNPYSWLWTDHSSFPFAMATLLVLFDAVVFVSMSFWWMLEFQCAGSQVAKVAKHAKSSCPSFLTKIDSDKAFKVIFYILVIYSYVPVYATFNSIIYFFGAIIISIDKTLPWLTGAILVVYYIQDTRQELIQTYTQIKREMFSVVCKESAHRAHQVKCSDVLSVDYTCNDNQDGKLKDKKHVITFKVEALNRPVLFTKYKSEDANQAEKVEIDSTGQTHYVSIEMTEGNCFNSMFSKSTLHGVCGKIKPIGPRIRKAALKLILIVFFLVLVVVTMTVFHPNAATTEARLVITSTPPLLIVLIRWLGGKMTTKAEDELKADIVKTHIQHLLPGNHPCYLVSIKETENNESNTKVPRTEVIGVNPLPEADRFFGEHDHYDTDGTTQLMRAARDNVVTRVRNLINAGADVNLTDEWNGRTALMFASENGHMAVVDALIKADAGKNIKDEGGRTAMMFASENGHMQVVAKLIEEGAKVNIKDKFGNTARKYASKNGHEEIVTELTRHDRGIILHQSELKPNEKTLLEELNQRLCSTLFDTKDTAELAGDVQKLTKYQELLDGTDRVILAFPGTFQNAQLMLAIQKMVKQQQASVAIIMNREDYSHLPQVLKEFNIRKIMVDRCMQDMDSIAEELKSFIEHDPEELNLAFLNIGNGLAWSYYFGYLSIVLPDLEESIMKSHWRKSDGRVVPLRKISKRMLIYPKVETTSLREDLKPRLIFHKNGPEVQSNRAGIDRKYKMDIREVKSQDLKETYYGIADYAKCLNVLIKLHTEKDRNVSFLDMNEQTMVDQGQFFCNRLDLLLNGRCMRKYNEKHRIYPSKFQLMPFVDTPRSAPEDQFVEDLFQSTKLACTKQPPVDHPVPTQEIGIILLPGVDKVIKRFVDKLGKERSTKRLSFGPDFEGTLETVEKVFIVLTDKLINLNYFDDLFNAVLRHGYRRDNRRFLVCLDNVNHANRTASRRANQLVLQLKLFQCIRYGESEWDLKLKTELEGDPQEMTFPLMFKNIGAGFAFGYYYGYLKIRIPLMKDIVAKTTELRKKFGDGLMSYKLFILHPHSCKVQPKVSDADRSGMIVDRDDDEELKDIKFEGINYEGQDYSPKLSSIIDHTTGKKYFVFVEYNTQADTLHKMMTEGFLDERQLHDEWKLFCGILNKIIDEHSRELKDSKELNLKDRMQIIEYDDTNMSDGDLADKILDMVKRARETETLDVAETRV